MSVAEIRIAAPGPGGGEVPSVRFGEPLTVVVDVELDEPWFVIPHLGRRITGNFDGVQEPAVLFEVRPGATVKSLASGRAQSADTGKDDHSSSPIKPGPAGRGCEVTVKSGTFEVTYSHLKRGTAKNGIQVRPGEPIAVAGNTGRCVDGAKGTYLKITARSKAVKVRPEEYADKITVEATLNGYSLGPPVALPEGELAVRELKLEPIIIDADNPDRYKRGQNELEVVAKRDARVIGRRKGIVTIDF